MALAILKYRQRQNGNIVFEADVGTNNWYEFKIGKSKRKYKGLDLVDEQEYSSTLIKAPVKDNTAFQTHFLFETPASLFDRENRYVQLFSYKDRNKDAPAISDVITIIPFIADLEDDFKLPKIMTMQQETYNMPSVEVKKAPFRIKENKVSEAMFFNALLGVMPGLLKNALPLIGKILPGLQKAAPIVGNVAEIAGKLLPELTKMIPQDVKPGSEGAQQVLQNISPETLKVILEIIQAQTSGENINGANGKNGHSESKTVGQYSHNLSINPAVLMQLAPLLEKVLSPGTIKAIGDNPVRLYKAIADSAVKFQKMTPNDPKPVKVALNGNGQHNGVGELSYQKRRKKLSYGKSGYSKAMNPALLAALPALMPLLEKVLSPDMIKAIGEQPIKLFTAIADAGLKHSKQELDHLEKINPGVDDPAFDKIVNSMSVKSAVTIKSAYSKDISIEFLNAKAISIAGKEKVVYDKRQKVTLPIQLHTSGKIKSGDKHIEKAIFQLIIQDADSMDVLFEKKYKLQNIALDKPLGDVVLDVGEMKSLPTSKDLKLELSFHWKDQNKTFGTFLNHYIMLTEGYVFERMGNNSERHFVLNDVERFRNFWHKVWEGSPATHERWKIDFECKYYYHINDEDAAIVKLETRKRKVSDSKSNDRDNTDYRRKIIAKLKSGMEVSLEAYNQLLKSLGMSPLTQDQLKVFKGHEFIKGSGVAARVSVDFRGRRGETASLWVYPEGNIQSYILKKTEASDATSLVTELQEEEVHFPRFSSAHFIGTQSK
jgi:hypothetical protein